MIKTIFKVLVVILSALLLSWFAFFNALQFEDYVWVWSNDNIILAWQYLQYTLWTISFVTCPAWIGFGTAASIKFLFKS